MPKTRRPGKLAVILHAEIAGSTSLVQQDEHLAHERIQDAFRRLGDTIAQDQGRVCELRGDALLAERYGSSPGYLRRSPRRSSAWRSRFRTDRLLPFDNMSGDSEQEYFGQLNGAGKQTTGPGSMATAGAGR